MKVRVAAVIEKDEKVLLMHYNYSGTVVHNLPGGNLEFGEKMRECLVRELIEELTIETTVSEEPIFSGEMHLNGQDTLHVIYRAEICSGEPVINPIETSAEGFEWVDFSRLRELNLYPNVSEHIEKWKSNLLDQPFIGVINQQWY